MVAKRVAGVAGSAAGGAAGGFLNNPGALAAIGIVVSIITTLVIFRKDISEFFSGLGQITLPTIEFPDITFPDFPDITFPDFPDITFPDFPDFASIFENFFNQFQFGDGDSGGLPLPPDVEDTGLLTPEERAECGCGTNIIQDIQGDVSETCITPCDVPEEGDPDFIGPVQPDEEFMLPTPPMAPPSPPAPPLPPGFEGGGPSFEGGFIFETNDCFLSLSQLIDKYGVTASQAADIKAQACTAEPGEQPTDIPEEFDFGTSTGAGGTPTTEESGIVTGGATLESEAQRAACTSCDLFGLNCPICRGEIGA